MLAMTAAAVAAWIRDPQVVGYPFLLLVVCVMPAFIAGFIEDMTKRVSPRERLLATMAAALVAVYLLNAKIVRIDIHLIDLALAIPWSPSPSPRSRWQAWPIPSISSTASTGWLRWWR